MSESFLPVTANEYLVSQSTELGLKMPHIELAERLATRLGRHSLLVEVDEMRLFEGTKQAEIENAMTIKVDALPKGQRSTMPTTTIDSDYYEGSSRVHLKIDADPELLDKHVNERINTAFWLGALVSEQVAEGRNAPQEPVSDARKYTRRFAPVVAVAVAGNGLTSLMHLGLFVGSPTAFGAWAAVTGAACASAKLSDKFYGRFDSSISHLQKQNKKQAQEFAREYPVLSYGVKY